MNTTRKTTPPSSRRQNTGRTERRPLQRRIWLHGLLAVLALCVVGALSAPSTADARRQADAQFIYLQGHKTTDDLTFSVAGGTFQIIDGNGVVAASVVSDATGILPFTIDPDENPPPYLLRELVAPPGLEAVQQDIEVSPPYSHDIKNPTPIKVRNRPIREEARVRKVVESADYGPADLAGFQFQVTRDADGRDIGTFVSTPNGATEIFQLPAGAYTVTEVASPPWASSLIDGGPVALNVALNAGGVTEVAYINFAPELTIATVATDASDGDKVIDASGGTVVDVVTTPTCTLVPGTEYTYTATLMQVDMEGAVHDSGVTGSITKEVNDPCEAVDVAIVVPPESPFAAGGTAVVFQTVTIAATQRVVAEHHDPADPDQTVSFEVQPEEAPGIPSDPPEPPSELPPEDPSGETPDESTPPEVSPTPTLPPPETLPPLEAGPDSGPDVGPDVTLPETGRITQPTLWAAALALLAGLTLIAATRNRPKTKSTPGC